MLCTSPVSGFNAAADQCIDTVMDTVSHKLTTWATLKLGISDR